MTFLGKKPLDSDLQMGSANKVKPSIIAQGNEITQLTDSPQVKLLFKCMKWTQCRQITKCINRSLYGIITKYNDTERNIKKAYTNVIP